MNQSKTCVQFWDSVANIYGEEELTKHDADHELDYVLTVISKLDHITCLMCLGVADGSRDPMQILDKLSAPVKSLICNDLSPKLLEVCKHRVDSKYDKLDAQFFSGPIHEVVPTLPKLNSYNTKFILGVYNVHYIKQCLQLYKEKQDVIGTKFKVTCLTFENNSVKQIVDSKITFDINSYEQHVDFITSWQKDPQFLAVSIETDTGFITHYYSEDTFRQLCELGGGLRNVESVGNRYIVATFENSVNTENTLVITMLNNVLGNISCDLQQESLQVIKDLFI